MKRGGPREGYDWKIGGGGGEVWLMVGRCESKENKRNTVNKETNVVLVNRG